MTKKRRAFGICKVLIAVSLSSCGSSQDPSDLRESLERATANGNFSVQLDLNRYDIVSGDTNISELKAGDVIYFTQPFAVKSGVDYSGLDLGVFAKAGEHIDNAKALTSPEACLIIPENLQMTPIQRGDWFSILSVQSQQKTTTSDLAGWVFQLNSFVYKQLFLRSSKVKDVTEVCFAGKVKILKPKK